MRLCKIVVVGCNLKYVGITISIRSRTWFLDKVQKPSRDLLLLFLRDFSLERERDEFTSRSLYFSTLCTFTVILCIIHFDMKGISIMWVKY